MQNHVYFTFTLRGTPLLDKYRIIMTPPLQVDRKNILGELPLYTLIFIFNMADKKVKNEFSLYLPDISI